MYDRIIWLGFDSFIWFRFFQKNVKRTEILSLFDEGTRRGTLSYLFFQHNPQIFVQSQYFHFRIPVPSLNIKFISSLNNSEKICYSELWRIFPCSVVDKLETPTAARPRLRESFLPSPNFPFLVPFPWEAGTTLTCTSLIRFLLTSFLSLLHNIETERTKRSTSKIKQHVLSSYCFSISNLCYISSCILVSSIDAHDIHVEEFSLLYMSAVSTDDHCSSWGCATCT